MVYSGRVEECSKRISKALFLRGMKQADLCNVTGIPKSAMSQYIKGSFEPKQDRIYLMASALNVSEAWLMGYDVPMEKETLRVGENSSNDGNGMGASKRKLIDFVKNCTEDEAERFLKIIDMVTSFADKKQ